MSERQNADPKQDNDDSNEVVISALLQEITQLHKTIGALYKVLKIIKTSLVQINSKKV